VSGTAGPITDVNVGLDGFTSPDSDHVLIQLVAPSGQGLLMQGCAGDSASGSFLTFDDAATTQLPDPGVLPTTGVFDPTAYCSSAFPPPGPPFEPDADAAPTGTATFASRFNDQSAIGTWSLFVHPRRLVPRRQA
jgi:hypothetical protein